MSFRVSIIHFKKFYTLDYVLKIFYESTTGNRKSLRNKTIRDQMYNFVTWDKKSHIRNDTEDRSTPWYRHLEVYEYSWVCYLFTIHIKYSYL